MPPSPTAEDIERALERLSAPLRLFVDRELAAGNRIVSIHGGFPAPPAGDNLQLERCVDAAVSLPNGVTRRDRQSSLYSAEFTDDERRHFVLTPPIEPEPLPSMDEIRRQHDSASAPILPPSRLAGWLEFDFRGETLTLHAGDRTASVTWTHLNGHRIYRESLDGWWDPLARVRTPMGEVEADAVFARIVDLARLEFGSERVFPCP